MYSEEQIDWPPENGLEFVQSEAFGRDLLAICAVLRLGNPGLDFSDSVASVKVKPQGEKKTYDYQVLAGLQVTKEQLEYKHSQGR